MNNTNGKKKKTKGPIRFEAIIPAIIVFALFALYFRFLFDANLRSALSYIATQVHGAEVNIGDISSSFLNPSISISNIQVTDKEEPSRNVFSLGRIGLKLNGDALLRAKLVVDKAEVSGIQAFSPRKRPGKVLPPPPPGAAKNSTVRQLEAEVLEQTQQRYEQNVLGDVATILGGVDSEEQLKNIQAELKSEQFLESLEKETKAKEEEWKKRLKELPKPKEFDALVERAKNLKFSSEDPLKALKNIKEIDEIIKEADKKIDAYKDTSRDFEKDYKNLEDSVKGLEDLVKEDVKDLQKRFNIPEIDSKNLSESIFMGFLDKKIAGFTKYAAMAETYMPKKKKGEEAPEQIVPRKRGTGEDVRYPITVGYPLFWLKEAVISSKANEENPYSGNLQGSLKNVSTAPSFINKPITLKLEGGFPYQGLQGMNANWESRVHEPKVQHNFDIKVASMQVKGMKLVDSKDLNLAMQKADAVLSFEGSIVDQVMNVKFENFFRQPEFALDTKDKKIREILGRVFESLPYVSLYGYFQGAWGKLNMRVSSNFGDEVVKGIQREVQAEIDKAKKKIEDYVESKISAKKQKVQDQVAGVRKEIDTEIDSNRQKMQTKLDQAKAEVKSSQKSKTKKTEEELKKGLKKLFKGI